MREGYPGNDAGDMSNGHICHPFLSSLGPTGRAKRAPEGKLRPEDPEVFVFCFKSETRNLWILARLAPRKDDNKGLFSSEWHFPKPRAKICPCPCRQRLLALAAAQWPAFAVACVDLREQTEVDVHRLIGLGRG